MRVADDYLPKPFSTAELLARVRAMLRRKDNFTPDLLTYNDTVLNRSTYEFSYKRQTQVFSGKEFQLMEMMLQAPGVIIRSEAIHHAYLGLGRKCRYQRDLGAHFQYPKEIGGHRCSDPHTVYPRRRLCAGGRNVIKQLQKRFIAISAAVICMIFALIFVIAYLLNVSSVNQTLDTLTDILSENDGAFPETPAAFLLLCRARIFFRLLLTRRPPFQRAFLPYG